MYTQVMITPEPFVGRRNVITGWCSQVCTQVMITMADVDSCGTRKT